MMFWTTVIDTELKLYSDIVRRMEQLGWVKTNYWGIGICYSLGYVGKWSIYIVDQPHNQRENYFSCSDPACAQIWRKLIANWRFLMDYRALSQHMEWAVQMLWFCAETKEKIKKVVSLLSVGPSIQINTHYDYWFD